MQFVKLVADIALVFIRRPFAPLILKNSLYPRSAEFPLGIGRNTVSRGCKQNSEYGSQNQRQYDNMVYFHYTTKIMIFGGLSIYNKPDSLKLKLTGSLWIGMR